MRRLLKTGIPRQRMLHLNLEDERLAIPTVATLDAALETFYRRHPQSRTPRSDLFLNEIQVVAGWERFLRSRCTPKWRVLWRGRGLAVKVLPYRLREAARAAGASPQYLA